MPPLFIYAVAFLSVLMVVGFVLCRREDARPLEASSRSEGRDAPPPVPGRRAAPPHPAFGQGPSTSANEAPAYPRRSHAFARPNGRAEDRDIGQDRAGRPAAVPVRKASGDVLPGQIAQLFAEVEALKAERKIVEDEIRRLNRIVGRSAAPGPRMADSPTAAVIELRARRIGA
jgi:hypothetical protein